MEALTRLNNANVQALQDADFAPVAYLEESGPQTLERFQLWAMGAIAGISLWDTATPASKDLSDHLATSLLEILRLESEDKNSTPDVSLSTLYDVLGLLLDAYEDHRNTPGSGLQPSPERYFSDRHPHERDAPKVGRNDPCPCGSGKKYKKCCMS